MTMRKPKRRPKPKPKHRGRVHAICSLCYRKSPLQREPIVFPLPLCYRNELCCFCGHRTFDAIYVRTLRVPRKRCCPVGRHPRGHISAGRQDDHYDAQGRLYGVVRRYREGEDLREAQ